MIQKFSVRKPFTVLVGAILVIVLGVVSFARTSTDLLPEMEMPIAAVITTYIGATPEQVEREVTSPLETSMTTLSGIDTVTSISSEHFSLVILQFVDGINMDSTSLEIRENLDMLQLPEGASKPMTLKMDPSMMPIMVASAYMEGMEPDELTKLIEDEIRPAIETVPGVAQINLSGLVQNQLNVILHAEKVEEVNEKLAEEFSAAIEEAMAAAMEDVIAGIAEELIAAGMPEEMAMAQAAEMADEMMSDPAALAEMMQPQNGENRENGEDEDDEYGEMPEIAIPAEMISVDAISGILAAQNFAMPAGMTVDGESEYMVRVGDRFEELDEIKNLVLFDPAAIADMMSSGGESGMSLELDIEPILLSDVADVFESDTSGDSYSRVNGSPAIMLTIQKQSEFSTADVTNDVLARMDKLSEDYEGLDFAVLMNQGEMIGLVVGSMLSNLLWGGLLAILILFLFLRDIRPTLIVAVSIPLSLMLAFTLMYFTGVNLNMLSMGGLALAVGMLVDNSIVVIENIYRMRNTTDRSAARSAVSGAKQVAGAIAASSLTTIAVFLPIVFTGGITRQLFSDLALTIAYSLLASLIIALSVVPAASSVVLRKVKKEESGKFYTGFLNGYENVLKWSLKHKAVVILVSVAAFVLSTWGIFTRGAELFPAMDMGQLSVTADMPEGSTFEDTIAVADEFTERVSAIADVETVGTSISGGGGQMAMMGDMMGMGDGSGGGGGTTITMYVLTKTEDRTATDKEIAEQINAIITELGLEGEAGGGEDMMAMLGSGISISISGDDLDAIRDTAIALGELVRSVEGAINVTDVEEEAAEELRVIVDKDAAMGKGLTVAQVFMAVNQALTEPEKTVDMTLVPSGVDDQTVTKDYKIIIKDGDYIKPGREELENLQIETQTGGSVTLSDVAEVREDLGFETIFRTNRTRQMSVTGEVDEGYNVGLINDEIERLLEDFVPEPGCTVSIGGQAEMMNDAFGDLYLMLALAIIFIYLIMVAQFQSLLSPFIILLTIPLAFTGGFLALLISGSVLSLVSMIGLILLTGVVVNNGIVFVSRVNQMRWEGMPKKDALIDAGRKRIRPILMTALTTIFAMSVMALGIGDGTEMMQPMAIVTIGGLIYATLMTLVFVPVLYDLFHKNKDVTKENLDDDGEEIIQLDDVGQTKTD